MPCTQWTFWMIERKLFWASSGLRFLLSRFWPPIQSLSQLTQLSTTGGQQRALVSKMSKILLMRTSLRGVMSKILDWSFWAVWWILWEQLWHFSITTWSVRCYFLNRLVVCKYCNQAVRSLASSTLGGILGTYQLTQLLSERWSMMRMTHHHCHIFRSSLSSSSSSLSWWSHQESEWLTRSWGCSRNNAILGESPWRELRSLFSFVFSLLLVVEGWDDSKGTDILQIKRWQAANSGDEPLRRSGDGGSNGHGSQGS